MTHGRIRVRSEVVKSIKTFFRDEGIIYKTDSCDIKLSGLLFLNPFPKKKTSKMMLDDVSEDSGEDFNP